VEFPGYARFKIKFENGIEISLHKSEYEFIHVFLKKYNQYMDKIGL